MIQFTVNKLNAGAYRGYHGAPITDPYDNVVIEVNGEKEIECKASKPVTWVTEVDTKIILNFKISLMHKLPGRS